MIDLQSFYWGWATGILATTFAALLVYSFNCLYRLRALRTGDRRKS